MRRLHPSLVTRSDECDHGYATKIEPAPGMGSGWLQRYARGCPKCKGAPAHIPYKLPVQALPDMRDAADAEALDFGT